jgi:hypothetical protein
MMCFRPRDLTLSQPMLVVSSLLSGVWCRHCCGRDRQRGHTVLRMCIATGNGGEATVLPHTVIVMRGHRGVGAVCGVVGGIGVLVLWCCGCVWCCVVAVVGI